MKLAHRHSARLCRISSFNRPLATACSIEFAISSVASPERSNGSANPAKTIAFASMMSGIAAAAAGLDAQAVAIAASSGANAAQNNYLTHAQEAQRDKELAACKTNFACEAGVKLNYIGISVKQEAGLIVGVFGGVGYQTYEQGAAVVEMVKNLPETLTALSAIVSDPEFRAKVGDAVVNDYQQRIAMQTRAYNEGGWDGSITAGVEAGRLAVDIVSAGTAAVGMGKVVAMTAKAGAAVAADVGALARNISSAGKNSVSEFIPATGQTTVAIQADGVFATQGLNIDPMRLPDGVRMVRELERNGFSQEKAILLTRDFINAGSTPPVATPLDITDKLVKVVPAGGQPSASTGYWMRESEWVVLQQEPGTIANRLGLPPGMHAAQFDVYQITPRQGAVVFESTIAPTTVNGVPSTSGGALQAIVLDRNQFTLPVKVGSIQAK
ncbi:MAG: hypothetical protein U1E02_09105 [Hydrogenophaga sp.]|nr:hypothetical protein [Burkholderiaceae bacterium]MDZ4124319.1 hypothetical protein [Hydrogenophaga sp.]